MALRKVIATSIVIIRSSRSQVRLSRFCELPPDFIDVLEHHDGLHSKAPICPWRTDEDQQRTLDGRRNMVLGGALHTFPALPDAEVTLDRNSK